MIFHFHHRTGSKPRLLFATAVIGALTSVACAQTLDHYYAGGENDSGAVAGGAVTTTTDAGLTGTMLNTVTGSVTYTATTDGGGSSLAYAFDGSGYLTSADVDHTLGNADSFFIELNFNASDTSATSALLYNGSSTSSGMGLYLYNGELSVVRGGLVLNQIATVSSGTWYDVAVVYDNGSGAAYINGTRYAVDFSSGFYALNGGALTIGGSSSGGDLYSGIIDDVRISTFASGTFDASMLSYSAVPEPATYAALAGLASLGIAHCLRRRRLRRA